MTKNRKECFKSFLQTHKISNKNYDINNFKLSKLSFFNLLYGLFQMLHILFNSMFNDFLSAFIILITLMTDYHILF